MITIATFSATILVAAYLVWRLLRPSSSARYLPKPPGRLLIGNLKDMPSKDGHLAYAEMAKTLGPIFQLQVPIARNNLIIISDARVASELLDKRGAIYSDRPPFYMNDMSGWEWNAAHMPHGEAWRARRRLVHQRFGASSTPRMEDLLRRNVAILVQGFLETPGEYRHHIRRFAAANIIKAVYGIDVAPRDDPYVAIAEKAVDLLGVVVPGSNLVDVFPFLRFVPPWVPFFGRSTRLAREMRPYPTAMIEVPYKRVRDDMKQGVAQQSMVTDLLSAGIDDKIVKEAGAVSYLGGADTMVSTMLAVVLSMVLHPDIQSRAQAELDAVLGSGENLRLPTLSDVPRLPYIEAIIKEAYRHYPVVPLCVPHAVETNDMYEGMLIPRGATVVANIWAILHDPNVYPNPQNFDPARWLTADPPPDPRTAVFGFGRRICPGRHFADASVSLVVASILKCFSFSTIPGKRVTGEMHTSLVSCPVPFECNITPRSERILDTIEKEGHNFAR